MPASHLVTPAGLLTRFRLGRKHSRDRLRERSLKRARRARFFVGAKNCGGDQEISRDLRVNGQIRVREVRVIDQDGEQLGILQTRDALALAQERDLDLVEVAPNAKPPVCRIMDYGKFRYEQSKREREARRRQKVFTLKEVRMSPKIDTHDLQIKLRQAQRFLQDGDKVKLTVRFRGREIVHADLARQKLTELAKELNTLATVERAPRLEGRQMIMILAPATQETKSRSAAQSSQSQ